MGSRVQGRIRGHIEGSEAMARSGELSARQVAALTKPGRHRVADNLFLLLRPPRKSWLNMFTCPLTRHEHEMGLGPVSLVSVPEAKAIVLRHRTLVHEGRCPLCERRSRTRAPKAVVFREVAELYVRSRQALWRSVEHRRQWDVALAAQAKAIWDLPVATIDTGAVMEVLEREWREKAPTLSRVRGRIEQVLDFATVRGWRSGENPARWRGHLDKLLPSPKKMRPVQHHAALPWISAPGFWQQLCGRTDLPALFLQFLLLTAVRRGEALEARWDEIDIASAVWTIPANRTKSGREHRVPLSAPALAVLAALAQVRRNDLLFPGMRHGRPIAAAVVLEVFQSMQPGMTLHGLRATFRTWCAEASGCRQDIAEAALAHVIEDKVVASYQRGDLLSLRADLMAQWARFLIE
jgi:integrase